MDWINYHSTIHIPWETILRRNISVRCWILSGSLRSGRLCSYDSVNVIRLHCSTRSIIFLNKSNKWKAWVMLWCDCRVLSYVFIYLIEIGHLSVSTRAPTSVPGTRPDVFYRDGFRGMWHRLQSRISDVDQYRVGTLMDSNEVLEVRSRNRAPGEWLFVPPLPWYDFGALCEDGEQQLEETFLTIPEISIVHLFLFFWRWKLRGIRCGQLNSWHGSDMIDRLCLSEHIPDEGAGNGHKAQLCIRAVHSSRWTLSFWRPISN